MLYYLSLSFPHYTATQIWELVCTHEEKVYELVNETGIKIMLKWSWNVVHFVFFFFSFNSYIFTVYCFPALRTCLYSWKETMRAWKLIKYNGVWNFNFILMLLLFPVLIFRNFFFSGFENLFVFMKGKYMSWKTDKK